jgi:hypothetical protein
LYLALGRFIFDAKQRASIYYAVTSKRIIIISGVFSRHAKSLNLETLTDLLLVGRADGSGTIVFGRDPFWYYCPVELFHYLRSNKRCGHCWENLGDTFPVDVEHGEVDHRPARELRRVDATPELSWGLAADSGRGRNQRLS